MSEKLFVGDASRFASGEGVHAVSTMPGQRLVVADAAREFNATLRHEERQFLMNDKVFEDSAYRADSLRADDISNGSLFFSRALELLTAKSYEVAYEELPFRKVFPVINEGGPGVQTITSEVYDYFAKAQLINAGAKDIPMVAGGGKEIKYPVVLWGIGASWNIQELQSFVVAQRNGRGRYSPEQIRMKAALRGLEEALNDQVFFGTPGTGIFGALNNPLVPNGPVAPSATTPYGTLWTQKSSDEILLDIETIGDTVFVSSKMRERPNKLLLPPSRWSYLKNRRLENRDISILTYLVENSQYFQSPEDIVPINELEGAGYSGTGKMLAYAKDPDKMVVEIPAEAQAMPVQQNMFSYLMLWYAYSAGLVMRYPRAAASAEGI